MNIMTLFLILSSFFICDVVSASQKVVHENGKTNTTILQQSQATQPKVSHRHNYVVAGSSSASSTVAVPASISVRNGKAQAEHSQASLSSHAHNTNVLNNGHTSAAVHKKTMIADSAQAKNGYDTDKQAKEKAQEKTEKSVPSVVQPNNEMWQWVDKKIVSLQLSPRKTWVSICLRDSKKVDYVYIRSLFDETKLLGPLPGHFCVFSPNEQWVCVYTKTAQGNQIKAYATHDGKALEHSFYADFCKFSSDSQSLFVRSVDNHGLIYSFKHNKISYDYNGYYAEFCPNGKWVLLKTKNAEDNYTFNIDQIGTNKSFEPFVAQECGFSLDGNWLYLKSNNEFRLLSLQDLAAGKQVDECREYGPWKGDSCMFSPNSTYMLVKTYQNNLNQKHKNYVIDVYSLENGQRIIERCLAHQCLFNSKGDKVCWQVDDKLYAYDLHKQSMIFKDLELDSPVGVFFHDQVVRIENRQICSLFFPATQKAYDVPKYGTQFSPRYGFLAITKTKGNLLKIDDALDMNNQNNHVELFQITPDGLSNMLLSVEGVCLALTDHHMIVSKKNQIHKYTLPFFASSVDSSSVQSQSSSTQKENKDKSI
jgi:hypothetical protein